VITGPEVREPYLPIYTTWDARLDLKGAVQYAIDLRRGIDLLETLPEIDATRIGFVGYSSGAWEGAYISGLEDRIDAYVFASGGQGYPCIDAGHGTLSCHVTDEFRSWPSPPGPQELERYMVKVGSLLGNTIPYVSHNEGAAFLIQMGTKDEYASTSTVDALFEALPQPKLLRWYDVGHTLGCTFVLGEGSSCDPVTEAFVDHRAWLQESV
jgi:dienelactone hydrolase